MRISDWSSDVCSSDFHVEGAPKRPSHGSDLAQGVPGEPLYVTAQVVADGHPVAGAEVDTWHADADGFYDVQDEHWSVDKAWLRAAFRTDDVGRFSFKSILPKSYPIPTDGTVGEMLAATNRSPMRPAHIHFKVEKDGLDPLITQVFAAGDEFLYSDAVFGVRGSCIGHSMRHDSGPTPYENGFVHTFYSHDSHFTIQPVLYALYKPND